MTQRHELDELSDTLLPLSYVLPPPVAMPDNPQHPWRQTTRRAGREFAFVGNVRRDSDLHKHCLAFSRHRDLLQVVNRERAYSFDQEPLPEHVPVWVDVEVVEVHGWRGIVPRLLRTAAVIFVSQGHIPWIDEGKDRDDGSAVDIRWFWPLTDPEETLAISEYLQWGEELPHRYTVVLSTDQLDVLQEEVALMRASLLQHYWSSPYRPLAQHLTGEVSGESLVVVLTEEGGTL